jgi:hypothetical protein
MKPMKNSPVHDFILANKDNLRIAAAVGDAWPEAREKLAYGFLKRLNTRLMKELNGWESEPLVEGHEHSGFFQKKCYGLPFFKPTWKDEYWLMLEPADRGEKILFGVRRAKESIGKRPFSDEMFNAIPQYGTRNADWEVKIQMLSPAADWRKPEVLWRMHTDNSFLHEVAEQLLEVAKISEPIIDRLVKKQI